ncbi:U-box domain-containing protein 15 [Morus notabilis]|uniref:U-box domain-containing protein 15 n=1 Tax=Morus notabilis TaxID=981085 RepID=UPI000CED7059|nr:U-box domain-containing protein 15 [Morus notabilis]
MAELDQEIIRVDEGTGRENHEAGDDIQSNWNANVLQELVSVVEMAAHFGDYRRTQRKECYNLVRRMKLLLPLFDELRDLDSPIPDKDIACLCNLKKALVMARKLLKTCNEGSKIYLALESEAIMVRFHTIFDKISQALDDFSYEELGISDEVKEQIELMSMQLRRARKRTDTQDIELAMDMMVVFSKKDDRNADRAIIERLGKKLDLHSIEDLKIETIVVRNLYREKGGQNAESIQQIIDLLNKFRQIAGMEETNVIDDPVMPKMLTKSPSLMIPHEFLCPITLEIMTDPVIVASGQSYERESIQKWFDSNHKTCPKSRQTLSHLLLAPNYALKNLILQWSEKNNFQLPTKDLPPGHESYSSTSQKEEISSLVEQLSSSHLDSQRKAIKKVRMLSKENPENRILIAKSGGIPPLVQLLSYPDSKIQEHAVTALLNLSIDEANKKIIAREGAIPAIIQVLEKGNIEARENSAAALFSLSIIDENKMIVGLSNGIPPLVDLLQNGTIRGKKDAATALFNLSLNQANRTRAISAGIVAPLLQLLKHKNLGMVDEALSILLLIAAHPDGRQEIGQLSFIETLVDFIREGAPKNKECAASVLLELGSNNSSFMLAALQFGVYKHLVDITRSGTNRGQRKANAILKLMNQSEQIP